MNERLYRSRDDRIIAGVAGGVAEMFDIDPSLVRILWVILMPLTGGLLLLLYIVMAFVVPEEPAGAARWTASEQQHGSRGTPGSGGRGWNAPGWPITDSNPPGSGAPGSNAPGVGAPSSAMPASALPMSASGMPDGTGASAAGSSVDRGSGAPVAQTPGFMPSPVPDAPVPPVLPLPGSTPTGPMDWRTQRRADRDARRAARQAWRAEHHDGSGTLIAGLLLVLIGGFFLVRAYVPSLDAGRLWPILLVGLGLVLLLRSFRREDGPPSP